MITQPSTPTEVCSNQGCQYFVQQELLNRAAELLTRYITVAPPEYSQDVKQWLQDAGMEEK